VTVRSPGADGDLYDDDDIVSIASTMAGDEPAR
jgi:hypothetical protein